MVQRQDDDKDDRMVPDEHRQQYGCNSRYSSAKNAGDHEIWKQGLCAHVFAPFTRMAFLSFFKELVDGVVVHVGGCNAGAQKEQQAKTAMYAST